MVILEDHGSRGETEGFDIYRHLIRISSAVDTTSENETLLVRRDSIFVMK